MRSISLSATFIGWIAVFSLACSSGANAAAGHSTVAVTDDAGHTERFSAPPQRIVSLLPALAESVCALGHCNKLVGVDRFTNWPASVRALPKMGGGLDPNIEAIAALKPDLVLMAKSTRAQDRLRALGIRVLSLEPMAHADVARTLQRLDAVFGSQASGVVLAKIETHMALAASRVPAQLKGQKVYFEAGAGPYAAGEASFIGQTLKALGLVNIVPASMGPFPLISPEFVVSSNPQRIAASEKAVLDMPKRAGWRSISAIERGQVCALTPEQADVVVRPGPRMGEAALILATCIAASR